MNNETFEMVAKTLYGLEEILAGELLAIGANDIEIGMTAAVSVRRRCEPSVISRKPPRTARSISSEIGRAHV